MEFATTETTVPMENSSSSALDGVSSVLVVLVVALLVAGIALVLRKKKYVASRHSHTLPGGARWVAERSGSAGKGRSA